MTPEMNEEDRIMRVLEQPPAVAVPADFAARVIERLPEPKVGRVDAGHGLWPSHTSRRRTHYGRNAMLAGAVLLCCLLVAAAVASNGGDAAWRLVEWTALVQLAGIALWCGLAWRTRSYV
jgi:hypothetical protein